MLSVYRERSNAANGLLIDAQGRLIACEGAEFSRPGVVVRGIPLTCSGPTASRSRPMIAPSTLMRFIPIAEDYITNNAFGGPDMRTPYVTAGKTLYKVRTDVPGLPR